MRYFIIVVCLILSSTYSILANGYDIIQLKNGKIIEGLITELNPGKNIKMNIGGKVISYPMDSISNINRKKNGYWDYSYSEGIDTTYNTITNYKGILEIGNSSEISDYSTSHLKFNFINGVNINNIFYAGIGLQLQSYKGFDYFYLPIFLDMRINLRNVCPTTFFVIDLGYLGDMTKGSNDLIFYSNFGLGYKFHITNSLIINTYLSYDTKFDKYYSYYQQQLDSSYKAIIRSSNCISISFGIEF